MEKYGNILLPSEYFTLSKHAKKFANGKGNEYTASMLGTDDCPVFNIVSFDKMREKNTNKYLDEQGKEIKVSWMSTKFIYMGGHNTTTDDGVDQWVRRKRLVMTSCTERHQGSE